MTDAPKIRLTAQHNDILDCFRLLNPCPTADLIEAAQLGSLNSLRSRISDLRNNGYLILSIYGLRGVRESAYQLVGEP